MLTDHEVDAGPEPDRTAPGLHLWRDMLVFLFVLAGLLLVTDLGHSFSSDDGAYGLQVVALDDGTWPLERTLPVVPPDNEGVVNAAVTPDGPLPYVRHPGYVHALRAMQSVFGPVLGLHVLSLVAMAAFPLVVALVARSIDPASARPAFWLAAVSPVLVNGFGLWAHAPSGLLAAVALGALLELFRTEAIRWAALAAVAMVTAALIRTESGLWALAFIAAAFVLAPSNRVRLLASIAVTPTLLALVVERQIVAGLSADNIGLAPPSDLPTEGGWLSSRLPAAWHEVLAASNTQSFVGPLTAIAVVVLAFGAIRLRQERRREALSLLVVGAALYGVRLVVQDLEFATGLLAAWPIALVALIAAPIDWRRVETRLLIGGGALFTGAVLATQYASASGTGWGGRYLTPLVPVLAVMGGLAAASPTGRRVLADRTLRSIAVVILLAPVMSGALAAHRARDIHRDSIDYVLQVETDVVVTEVPSLPRLAWASAPEVEWYRSTPAALDAFLVTLGDADVPRITVQGFRDQELEVHGYDVDKIDNGLRQLVLRSA